MAEPWSVVVPTHNTRELTCRCLASLTEVSGLEITVVDDASSDGTCQEIRHRFPGVEIVRFEEGVGFAAAANEGLARASGDFLLVLNSDTVVPAESWPFLRDAFRSRARLGIAGGQLLFPDHRIQWSGGAEPSLPWLFALATGLPGLLRRAPGVRRLRAARRRNGSRVDWVSGAAMAFRREAWEELGPFDEGYRFYCQDLDICLRARRAGWEVAVVPGFRVIHHHGATIGKETGAAGSQHPEILWTDLVLWARKHRGRRWARATAAVLRWGGRGRLLGRAIGGVFLSSDARERWRRDSLSYRQALRALERY